MTPHTGPPDTGPPDTSPPDTGPPDTSPPDTGPPPGLATDVSAGPLDPGAFGRLLCDAVEQTVLVDDHRRVLHLGRAVRLATAAQRYALTARDRGCIIPHCTVPPAGCEAHHVTWWRHGGHTDLDNLALLCSRHHTAIHTGVWTIQFVDGIPWVVPPAWIDPTRTPVRNTTVTAEHAARTLGQHLRAQPPRSRPPRSQPPRSPLPGDEPDLP